MIHGDMCTDMFCRLVPMYAHVSAHMSANMSVRVSAHMSMQTCTGVCADVCPIILVASLAVAVILRVVEPWILRRCAPILTRCRLCAPAALRRRRDSDEETSLTQPAADLEPSELDAIEMA